MQTSSDPQLARAAESARGDEVTPVTAVAEKRVELPANVDLHARPAANFVRTAMRFSANVWVVVGEREVDAKSILSVLALGAKRGTTITLRADGDDAPAAIRALATTVAGLGE